MINTGMVVTLPRRTAWNRGGDGPLMTYDELGGLRVPGRAGWHAVSVFCY
jgi:hypothetical protein